MSDHSESLHRSVFQHLDDCVFVHRPVDDENGDLVLVDLNPKACEFLGVSHSEILSAGFDVRDLFAKSTSFCDMEDALRSLRLALNGFAQRFEWRVLRLNGAAFWAEIDLRRMKTGDGVFLLTTVHDIHDRKLLEAKLQSSESDYRTLAENLPLNIARWAPDGRYLYINPVHEKTLGKPAGEIIGTAIPASHDHVKATIAEVVATGKPSLFVPQRVLDKRGLPRFHEVSVVPEYDSDGQIVSLLGIGREMTEHYQTQEALVAQEQRFRSLLDNAPDNVACYDLAGRTRYMSKGLLDSLGLRSSDVVGKHSREVWPDGRFSAVEQVSANVTNTGEASRLELAVHIAGIDRVHEIQVVPERNAGGDIVGTIAFGRDVTERKKDEAELDQYRKHLEGLVRERTKELELARDEARSASYAKGAFLANMSHEIRTPLNTVLGMTHIMRRGDATPVQSERLGKIESATKHLLGVINNILDISKIEAGKLTLDHLPVSVMDVMKNVQTMVSEGAAGKGLLLRIEPFESIGTLYGDQIRLQQALLNYASNAIKFSEKGGVVFRAVVQEDANEQVLVRFEVEDNGIGIDPDKLPRLFSAFEQADNSINRKYGGTGLGLAITRRLAELMGGEVGVRSVPGVGSAFWFTAVLRKENVSTGVVSQKVALDAEQILSERYAGTAILVVDDDAMNREIAESILVSCGLVVDVAENGEVSLRKIEERSYALVLMDMQMPVMDGLEATRRIRDLPKGKHLPVVAMTANVYGEDRQRCFNAGMDDFLMKPFEPNDFFQCALRWLENPHGMPSSEG